MHQRALNPSAFPGDTGEATPGTRRLLAAQNRDRTVSAYLAAVAALCGDRLLVPVVATATRRAEAAPGRVSDAEAEMSVVGLRLADGRRALLAFTGLDSLAAWDPAARPVPVTVDAAAGAARDDGADAVLVDPAGPDPLLIDGEVLDRLGAGHRLVDLGGGEFGWASVRDRSRPPVDPR